MSRYSLTHLADHILLRDLGALMALDRVTTADLLAHMAEVDARKLYLPAGYASLFTWCVGELHLSEDAAAKRIHAARAAREYPTILAMVADGRLHLSAVGLLAPHLTPQCAEQLLAAATHKTRNEIQLLLAAHAPQPEVPTRLVALPAVSQHAPGHAEGLELQHAPGHVERAAPAPPAPVRPRSPQRYALQVTLAQATHDKLRRAQELLGHGPCAHAALGD